MLRAQVQHSAQQQRVVAAANDFEKQKLTLARVIGLPLGQVFTLDPAVPDVPTPTHRSTLRSSVRSRRALTIQAALARVRAAEAARDAAEAARPAIRQCRRRFRRHRADARRSARPPFRSPER